MSSPGSSDVSVRSERQCNKERRVARNNCRKVLAGHISRLGLAVRPAEVRLHPSDGDEYRWSLLDKSVHGDTWKLFFREDRNGEVNKRNISDQSVGSCRDLCRMVGKTFEAVRISSNHHDVGAHPGESVFNSAAGIPASFTSRIEELKTQNHYLTQRVEQIGTQLKTEIKQRLAAEESSKASQGQIDITQERLGKAIRREKYFRTVSLQYAKGVSKIRSVLISHLLPILDELQDSAGMTAEGSCMPGAKPARNTCIGLTLSTFRHVDEVRRVKYMLDMHYLEMEANSLHEDIVFHKSSFCTTIRFLEESLNAITILNAAIEAFNGKANNAECQWKQRSGIIKDYKEAIYEMKCLAGGLPRQFLVVFNQR